MLWINFLALAAFIAGFVAGWRVIKRGRAPFKLDDTSLLSWEENPAPVLHYDKLAALIITFHGTSILVLCALLIFSVNRAADSPLSPTYKSPLGRWLLAIAGIDDPKTRQISAIVAGLAVGIGAFIGGSISAFPFVRWRARPVLVHIVPDGIIYGQTYVTWPEIADCRADPVHRLLRLSSSTRPQSLAAVLHPPTDTVYAKAERRIRESLLQTWESVPIAWYRRRPVAALSLSLIILVILVSAFWAYTYVTEWAWALLAFEIWAVAVLGAKTIRIYF
jgi:hypothetical protein